MLSPAADRAASKGDLKMLRRTCALVSIAFALSLFAATGAATTVKRTFVASTGNDANQCSIAAPCRGFARAITQTSAGGEVIVLDSAGYGPVTITQSVSITSPPGVYAGISVQSGDGITINAPGATVVLRGLTINGQGGLSGANVQQAAKVRIESCTISNMGANGVVHAALAAELVMLDTIVRDNAGSGINITADASVVLDQVRSERNGAHGLYIVPSASETRATIARSLFVSNGLSGISADTNPTANTFIDVDDSMLSGNGQHGFNGNAKFNSFLYVTLTRSTLHRNASRGAEFVADPASACPVTGCTANGVLTGNSIAGNGVLAIEAVNPGTRLIFGANTFAWNLFSTIGEVNGGIAFSSGNNMGIAGGSYMTSSTF
jgi:hypothetical protein